MNLNFTFTDEMRETLAWALREAVIKNRFATDTETKLMLLQTLSLAEHLRINANIPVPNGMRRSQMLRDQWEAQRRATQQAMTPDASWPYPPSSPWPGSASYAPETFQQPAQAQREEFHSGGGGDFGGAGASGSWEAPAPAPAPAPEPAPSYDSGSSYSSDSYSSSDSSSSSSSTD